MSLSDLIQFLISPLKNIFFFHKKKLVFFIAAAALFFLFLFPYSDLTSFSQEKINQAIKSSGGQVSYSEINFNLSPFGIKTESFEYQAQSLKSPLKIESITVRPNLLSLLKLQPGGSLVLEGFFGGEASAGVGLNGKTQEKTHKFNLSLDLKKISLSKILEFLGQSIKIDGGLFGNLTAEGEESFRVQPNGQFKFNLQNVTVPTEVPSPIGNIELPTKIVWKNSNIFGKFEKGRVSITDGTLGTKQAPVNGRFKGYINCSFLKSSSGVTKECTDYNIKIELELDANFQKNVAEGLSSFLDPKNVNKVSLPQGGARYLFSVQGNASRSYPPRFSRLSNFE